MPATAEGVCAAANNRGQKAPHRPLARRRRLGREPSGPFQMQSQTSLPDKVLEWLNKQGYPTEFQVANICHRNGFRVFQGYHVRSESSDVPREIDVLAQTDDLSDDYLIRVCHVIECKWSRDKPWVVLTSRHGQLANPACVAQTIGSLLGWTILWTMSQDPDLHALDLFSTPDRPGFSGRQVFSQSADLFYSTMQSVVDVSMLEMAGYDEHSRRIGTLPRNAVIAFPMIVVDGQIFEAFFDEFSQNMRVEQRKLVRVHWRGARSWHLHATIDVVSLDHLDEFLKTRAHDVTIVLEKLKTKRNELAKCFEEKSLDGLKLPGEPRGISRIPPLLREAIAKTPD
jgi:hypothetical protein